MKIGLISDTHGILDNKALDALAGVDRIVHAGDVGDPAILTGLATIAPVTAVRGNTDGGPWARRLPPADMISLAGRTLYVLHDLTTLDLDPEAAGVQVVVSGHTHQAEIKTIRGVLYINPGSASRPRHGGRLSVARITLNGTRLAPEIIFLDD